ncbi:MAG: F0F1 ATP synthase subunit B' [Defluviicoccus sp.]|nr:F0F1 ATP synthase subunit B' [Defluviicoccus sp.]MDE0384322.1 F0F1 ATP synthase subunit B' [Defluviicoccus sp.]
MPQLEQVDTFLSQLVWLFLTFGVLYVVILRSALPRISQILATRQERIDGDLRRAEEIKAEAESVLAAYEAAAARARAEAQDILRESSERFATEAGEKNEALTRLLAEQAAAGEARIGAARERAMAEVETIAAELAGLAAERLTGTAADRASAAAAVARVMGERV